MKIKKQVSNQLINLLKQAIPSVKLIYLFGSYAKQQATVESDIDVAFLADKKLLPVNRWEIQQQLAEQLDIDIDLVDLLSASTVMQNEIIHQGKCIFSLNNEQGKFEMQVMSMYQNLNEKRADILTDFMRNT